MSKLRFRKRRRRKKQQRRPINVLASVLTTVGLCCGVGSMFAAMSGEFARAGGLIIIAMVFDMLDGSVAKLTHSASDFGKQFDSLCDLVSFGAAPGILVYSLYLADADGQATFWARAGSVMAVIFVVCGALRLARFTLYQTDKRDYFVGLPIPAAGVTLASYVLFMHYFEAYRAFWALGPMAVALGLLMVSTVPYPKDRIKTVILAPRNAFRLLLVSGIVIAFFVNVSDQSPAVILFPVTLLYVLLGLGESFREWRRRRGAREQAPPQLESGAFTEAAEGDGRAGEHDDGAQIQSGAGGSMKSGEAR